MRLVCNRAGGKLAWAKAPVAVVASAPGGNCTKAGATARSSRGVPLTCGRSGSRLVWEAVDDTPPAARPGAAAAGSIVLWNGTGAGDWVAGGAAPPCSADPWTPPLDVAAASGLLVPGQVRGGNYKAHGGFRFDGRSDNAVRVVAPFAGTLYRGAAYLEDDQAAPTGRPELQYLVDIQSPCGFMVRFDHLRVLSPALKAAFDANVPVRSDSRTTPLPVLQVQAGDLLATEVGHRSTGLNVSVDFGVYDLRARRTTTRSAAELQQLGSSPELAWHGVCWLDLFGAATAAKLRALPVVGVDGPHSDYCT